MTVKEQNNRKKEYLNEYKKSDKRIKLIDEQLQSLRESSIHAKNQILSFTPRSTGYKDLSDVIVEIEKSEEILQRKKCEKISLKNEIEMKISELDNEEECEVMRMRYVQKLDWEEIFARMDRSPKYVYSVHGRALKSFNMELSD